MLAKVLGPFLSGTPTTGLFPTPGLLMIPHKPHLPATPQLHLGLGLEHLLCAWHWAGRHRDELTAGPHLQSAQNLCEGDKNVDPSEPKASKTWPRGGPGLLYS